MHIDNQYLKKILKSVGDSTANKICKRIETLESARLISSKDAFVLKSELKNIVHESLREIKNHVLCWNQGFIYNKLNIYNPTEKKQ